MFLLKTWDELDFSIEVSVEAGVSVCFYSFLLASDSSCLELGDEAGLFCDRIPLEPLLLKQYIVSKAMVYLINKYRQLRLAKARGRGIP